MSLRVGIVGAGQAGERHAVGFSAVEGATVAAIADLDRARAVELADRFGARAHTDWRRMLDAGLEVLVVALPHNLHVEPALRAAAAGVHVLMEKPLATTLDDAQSIVRACDDAGVKLTISFVHRFREELQVAQSWIRQGAIGDARVVTEIMNTQRGAHLPAWVDSKAVAGGGVLMYTTIHGIDRLRWLLASEIASVTAVTHRFDETAEIEQGVAALLTFASGETATLTSCGPTYRAQPAHWDTQLYGTAGMMRIRTRYWVELSNDDVMKHCSSATVAEQHGLHYNFIRQAASFVDAIVTDSQPAITGEDGLKALGVVFALYESAETGKVVEIH